MARPIDAYQAIDIIDEWLDSVGTVMVGVEADRDGRCVVLPCKVGGSLWVHDKDGKPREMKLDNPDI